MYIYALQIVSFVKSQVILKMCTWYRYLAILKSVKVHFFKYLSLSPTKIIPIVPFYVSEMDRALGHLCAHIG